MKKILAFLLAAVMILGLAACGKDDTEPEPLPDSSAVYSPEPTDPDPDDNGQGWVPPSADPEEDYLTTAIADLSEYILSSCRASYLGKLEMGEGHERHLFLYQPGQSPEDLVTYGDLSNKLSIIQEETALISIDRAVPDPTLVQSLLTNYGTIYVYDLNGPMDMTKYTFQHSVSTGNDVVDRQLETYHINLSGMVDITMQPKVRENSLSAYRLSANLWALPDTMEFSFVERELNELDENTTTRTNYSSEITFMVWGVDPVPMTAELSNVSIEQYPHYEIKQPSIFQSPVMPYVYTISGFYDEGVVTAEMDANDAYISARNAIETQFVLTWGSARVPFSNSPVEVAVDINQYLPQ